MTPLMRSRPRRVGLGPRDRPAGPRRTARRCRGRRPRRRCSRYTSAWSPMPMSTKSMTWPCSDAVDEVADGATQQQAKADGHERTQAGAMAPLVPADADDDEDRQACHQQRRGVKQAEDGPVVVGLGDTHERADDLRRSTRVTCGDTSGGQFEGAVDVRLGGLVEQHHGTGQAAEERPAPMSFPRGLAGLVPLGRGWRLSHLRSPARPSRCPRQARAWRHCHLSAQDRGRPHRRVCQRRSTRTRARGGRANPRGRR